MKIIIKRVRCIRNYLIPLLPYALNQFSDDVPETRCFQTELRVGWRGHLRHQGLPRWLFFVRKPDWPGKARWHSFDARSFTDKEQSAESVPAPRLTAAWSPGAPTELERGGCGSRRMKARFLEATGTFWSGGAGRRLGEALPPPSLTGRGFPHRPLPNFRSSKEASPAGPRSRSLAS